MTNDNAHLAKSGIVGSSNVHDMIAKTVSNDKFREKLVEQKKNVTSKDKKGVTLASTS